jgi:hypothetical protein
MREVCCAGCGLVVYPRLIVAGKLSEILIGRTTSYLSRQQY